MSTSVVVGQFLNRVNAATTDDKESDIKLHYISNGHWLLRACTVWEADYQTLHAKVPFFLVTDDANNDQALTTEEGWNNVCLKGQYYAGKYILIGHWSSMPFSTQDRSRPIPCGWSYFKSVGPVLRNVSLILTSFTLRH